MINKVTLIGNTGGDPDFKTTESGTNVARFSLATSDAYKDKDGNWQNQTEWHNVVVWRDLADRVNANLKKGMRVYVEGKITYRKYTDKDGHERSVTDIVASVVRSLEKAENAHAGNAQGQQQAQNYQQPAQPATQQQPAQPFPTTAQTAGNGFNNRTESFTEDLPF